jgi:predicted metalloprotease with PDZ domain
MRRLCTAIVNLALLAVASAASAQTVAYRLAVTEPERGWMDVELLLRDAPPGALELRMSRSSPGRYSLHDFARGVSDVHADDGAGTPQAVSEIAPSRWRVERHGPTLRVRYRVSGMTTDGTYLGIDAGHAHINMPAALLRVTGADSWPVTISFDPPAGRGWRIATQLFPGPDARTFTAPNLQYLMDSPVELSAMTIRSFSVWNQGSSADIRLAVHHTGSDADVDALTSDVERIVREARAVFGELPAFDNGAFTFIADYLPTVVPDGMEHRNSTVVTARGSIQSDRVDLLGTIAHEFFHAWNVERIRPASLEPFDFDESNPASELWFGEGFTQYYGHLLMARSGLLTMPRFAGELGGMVGEVLASPARTRRSLEEMSRLAVVVDGAAIADVTGLRDSYLSYYTWGGVVALALDLTLRDRSDGRVTLDHFMRLMWARHGRAGGAAPGYVDAPFTTTDLKNALATVSGDAAFADDFFARYIQGRDVANYDRLFSLAGFEWRSGARGRVLIPAEATGRDLTDAQKRFRAAWLDSLSTP